MNDKISLIAQNISEGGRDIVFTGAGISTESGIPDDKVIELHGSNRRVRCMSCGGISSIHEAQKRIESGEPAPECECGGYLKPDTISFGQAMPEAEVEKANKLSRNCDFFMVVGSTLLVHPAASMPNYAKESGAFLAIVNLSETPCDEMCDALIRGKAGEVLKEIVDRVGIIIHVLFRYPFGEKWVCIFSLLSLRQKFRIQSTTMQIQYLK